MTKPMTEPRLTSLSHGGGCGCKIAPGVLSEILKNTASLPLPPELLVGIEILPDGKRKEGLDTALRKLMERLFGSRILSFDQQAAIAYAPIVGRARTNGRLISVADGQIAAIAVVHGFTIATRDIAPFVAAGVPVINPWEE